MKNPLLFISRLAVLGALFFCASLQAAERIEAPHIEVALLSEVASVQPGESFSVGVLLEPEEGWHTYWLNPGDTGLPTRVSWDLPDDVSAGGLQWPYPERADYQGLTNYGYNGPALLIADIEVPANYSRDSVDIAAQVDWLVCEEVCIPGQGTLDISLPVGESSFSEDAGLFAETRAAHPVPLEFESANFQFGAEAVIQIHGVQPDALSFDRIEFFPLQQGYANNSATPRIIRAVDGLLIQTGLKEANITVPDELEGLLVIESDGEVRAVQFVAQPDPSLIPGSAPAATLDASLMLMLLFALLGGLILNLMPCVFPILSLKALSIVESSQYSAAQRRLHGMAYTAGVVVCFLVVAGVLLGLRAAGQEIGWGFQLQSPIFVTALAYLLFVLGLSLSGFIELGTSLMRLGNLANDSTGSAGSFLTGALAVIVATPCTAPFMGTAMGVALTLPTYLALLIFVALGVGLALPILAVSFIPAVARWFPKPGAWMVTFKEFLAFPLYLTVIWLLWVLARQTDVSTLALVLIGLVLISFSIWLWKQASHAKHRWISRSLSLVALLLAILILPTQVGGNRGETLLESQPWSNAALTAGTSSGRPVFVNFTADWCITCKVNERLVLETETMAELFRSNEVVYLKGDWTNADENITRVLAQFGRSGVPLYLLYMPGNDEPTIMPQILTFGEFERAFASVQL